VLLGLAMVYLVAKPSHVWNEVHGAILLPAPFYLLWMAYYGTMLPDKCCAITSLSSVRWPLSGGAKPPGLDIYHGVDHPSTCET
jgi:hypothetical protein